MGELAVQHQPIMAMSKIGSQSVKQDTVFSIYPIYTIPMSKTDLTLKITQDGLDLLYHLLTRHGKQAVASMGKHRTAKLKRQLASLKRQVDDAQPVEDDLFAHDKGEGDLPSGAVPHSEQE